MWLKTHVVAGVGCVNVALEPVTIVLSITYEAVNAKLE